MSFLVYEFTGNSIRKVMKKVGSNKVLRIKFASFTFF